MNDSSDPSYFYMSRSNASVACQISRERRLRSLFPLVIFPPDGIIPHERISVVFANHI